MRWHIPKAYWGQKIGLLGGSFDPPHKGHCHITQKALQHFALDQIWWVVSPSNPLKTRTPDDITLRMGMARALIHNPRVIVTDIERHIGTRTTVDTVQVITHLFPKTRFVWLMGSDNLLQFHRWHHWRTIMNTLPIGILARPTTSSTSNLAKNTGNYTAAIHARAARQFSHARVPQRQSRLLAQKPAPAWCLVNIPLSKASSTAERQKPTYKGVSLKKSKGVLLS